MFRQMFEYPVTDIDGTSAQLRRSGVVPDLEIRVGMTVQRVIHVATPAGVAIEIWECPTTQAP